MQNQQQRGHHAPFAPRRARAGPGTNGQQPSGIYWGPFVAIGGGHRGLLGLLHPTHKKRRIHGDSFLFIRQGKNHSLAAIVGTPPIGIQCPPPLASTVAHWRHWCLVGAVRRVHGRPPRPRFRPQPETEDAI